MPQHDRVGWRGEVYGCDFNQQLGMQWNNGQPIFLWDVNPDSLEDREIIKLGNHCFGCTAGAGLAAAARLCKSLWRLRCAKRARRPQGGGYRAKRAAP